MFIVRAYIISYLCNLQNGFLNQLAGTSTRKHKTI